MDDWLRQNLVCPRDHSKLRRDGDLLVSENGNEYKIIDGIPIMLVEEAPPTHHACARTPNRTHLDGGDDLVSRSNEFDENIIDLFVQNEVASTCGVMYQPLVNKLTRYPIPELPLSEGCGQYLLDIGCNWGRWCFSASRKGYLPVGIDPSLEAVLAAKRIAEQLGHQCLFVVGDARYLPFGANSFDVVFSYSVLQHFSEENVTKCLGEIARTLKPNGSSMVQMPNKLGLRNIFNQLKRGFRTPHSFEVRYRGLRNLKQEFTACIGKTSLSAEGFFALGSQISDVDILPLRFRIVVYVSEFLRLLSDKINFLTHAADSVYLKSRVEKSNPGRERSS